MLSANSKGEIAQLKVQLRAAEKNLKVSLPSTELRYDILLDSGQEIKRGQIKYCNSKFRKNMLRVDLDGRNKKPYKKSEIDILLVYIPSLDQILKYESNIFHNKKTIKIHLNNKKSKHFWKNFIW